MHGNAKSEKMPVEMSKRKGYCEQVPKKQFHSIIPKSFIFEKTPRGAGGMEWTSDYLCVEGLRSQIYQLAMLACTSAKVKSQ